MKMANVVAAAMLLAVPGVGLSKDKAPKLPPVPVFVVQPAAQFEDAALKNRLD